MNNLYVGQRRIWTNNQCTFTVILIDYSLITIKEGYSRQLDLPIDWVLNESTPLIDFDKELLLL
jgi:hypothetical protein